ncbi:MAG: hypothetical protein Q8936_08010 [Bacillota bacterium]|nr:hypothetical protein [Bacillota bacterium]
MPESIITAMISAVAILTGAVIGAVCSWLINRNTTNRNIETQTRIVMENRELEESIRCKKLCQNANVIRLDICTAIFQSIRGINNITIVSNGEYPLYIPINSEYPRAIASLTITMDLKEISYLYQLYGVIEKINHDIKNLNYTDKNSYELIKIDYEIFLKKLYGANFGKVVKQPIDNMSYYEMYDNDLIKEGYRKVLKQLDGICSSCNKKKN